MLKKLHIHLFFVESNRKVEHLTWRDVRKLQAVVDGEATLVSRP